MTQSERKAKRRAYYRLHREHILAQNRAWWVVNRPSIPTHGHAAGGISPTYRSWASLKARCRNANNRDYADYGGRGIGVYWPWVQSFAAFLADMGERPEGTSIDRIDNDFGYGPSNCRWANPTEQARNRR